MTRMFVAVVPPTDVMEDLDDFLSVRRDAGAFRWTLPEHLHVTLAFLDEVEHWQLDALVERLGDSAQRRTPFEARVAGGGAFPDAGRARVLWAGLRCSQAALGELERAASGARSAANRSGIEVDGRRFRPHLTLARLARPAEVSNWVRLLDDYAGPAWTVDHLALVASYLGEGPSKRPRYEVIETLSFGEAPRGRPDGALGSDP